MTNGNAVKSRFCASEKGGIPWFAFLDAQGAVVATSDGPKGNVGFPAEPDEIDHFVAMLRKGARRITPEQLAGVEGGLREFAARIKAARRG
ncbi:MAG TPA: hypothetical protein VFI25_19150 [Planctomycetota bacterium]|jgi:hypothetical protein|nr:hypothetical protein [Planctomycetota bacterium]